MPFLIVATDKPDSLPLRQEVRPQHLAYLEEHADKLLLAGARWTDDGETALGSVLIVDVGSRQEAEAFAAGDPFSRAGVFADVDITLYRVAYLDGTDRMA